MTTSQNPCWNNSIFRDPNHLTIHRRWFAWRYKPPVLRLIVLVLAFLPDIVAVKNDIWKNVIFSVVGSWFVFVMNYVLTKLIKSTYISVCHRPLPFAKNIQLDTSNITAIIQEQKRYKGRTRRKYYEMNARTPDGKKVTLVRYIDIEAQANTIKTEIVRFLVLENRSRT
ncbi:hypothetical protein [Kaarinaea lacus]